MNQNIQVEVAKLNSGNSKNNHDQCFWETPALTQVKPEIKETQDKINILLGQGCNKASQKAQLKRKHSVLEKGI